MSEPRKHDPARYGVPNRTVSGWGPARPPDPDALREAVRAWLKLFGKAEPSEPFLRDAVAAIGRAAAQSDALLRVLSVLDADGVDPNREPMWRYGVRHSLSVVRAALAAPAAPPPDLAALLHPWTCPRYGAQHLRPDGGWLCQRAAADIAFRLAPKEPPWPDHAEMSVDERRS